MASRIPGLLLFLLLILFTCLFFSGCSTPVESRENLHGDTAGTCGISTQATAVRVMDGDTLAVQYTDGTEETVRVLGIDTPETSDEGNLGNEYPGIRNPAHLTSWGLKASAYTRSLAGGEVVTLTSDCRAGEYDRYGRLLSYVDIDGTDLGALLISEGYARVYTAESFGRKSSYLALQSEAQRTGTGLWGDGDAPEEHGTLPVTITRVQYDAPGEDRGNLNGEYIVLASTEMTDLSGWTLTDNSGTTFTFRDAVLTPGTTLTLYIGSGTPTTTELYWNLSEPLLGNTGDSVILRDPDRNVIALYQWGR